MEKIRTTKKRGLLDGDKMFDVVNVIIMLGLLFIFLWPLWFVLIASVSDPTEVYSGRVLLLPSGFTLNCYKMILEYKDVWLGYRNTIIYTAVGTLLNVVLTISVAYPLSRRDFMGKKFFSSIFLFTMYFGGGLIPNFMVMQSIGLVNNPLVMILRGAISYYNVIIVRTYFQSSIPFEFQEAAEIDGASPMKYLVKVVVPLSKPIVAVISLYYAVGHWNAYFNALVYLYDRTFYPLQMFLRDILINSIVSEELMTNMDDLFSAERAAQADAMKYGLIIVAAVPLLCVYPFVQKYFVKGVMIGGLKG